MSNKKLYLDTIQDSYYSDIVESIALMFDYAPFEENNIEMATFLAHAAKSGIAAVCKEGEKFHVGFLSWANIPDDNGIADKCIISSGVNEFVKEYNTKDIAFFRFSHSGKPAHRLEWYAQQFTDCDDSENCLLKNTKYTPIPVVSNDSERAQMETALNRQRNGEPITVIVKPLTNPLLTAGGQAENNKILSVGDIQVIEKMHFLNEYYSELRKRLWTEYGMNFNVSSKIAQVTNDELHGMDNFSFIKPYIMLNEFKKFAKKCKKLWGWSDSVKFSRLWETEEKERTETLETEKGKSENDDTNDKQQTET